MEAPQFTTDIFSRKLGTAGEKISENLSTLLSESASGFVPMLFFFRLQEENDTVAGWSDSTMQKIKQVLTKALVECGYLDSPRAQQLNPVAIAPELEDAIRNAGNTKALPAFNCFRKI